MNNNRFLANVKVIVINVLLAVIILACLEMLIRIFCPQNSITTYTEGGTPGIKDKVIGHRLRSHTVFTQKTPEFVVEYRVNEHGMRDESPHSYSQSSKSIRILLLGDSFALGAGVGYEKIWPVIFERNLLERGYDVDIIKAGISGYDTRSELLYLKSVFDEFRPDIVILTFLPNDLFTNKPLDEESLSDASDSAIVTNIDKLSDLHVVTLGKRLLMSNDLSYTMLYLMTARAQFFKTPVNLQVKRQLEVTKELLAATQSYCRDKGTKFLVLSIPQQFQVIAKSHGYTFSHIDADLVDRELGENADRRQIIWIKTLDYLADQYRSSKEDSYYRFDGHLNSEGSRLVGRYLSDRFIGLFKDDLNKEHRNGFGPG